VAGRAPRDRSDLPCHVLRYDPAMADGPFYSPQRQPPLPQVSKPGELLWSRQKGGRQITWELRSHGEYGWEAQLFREGEFYAGRRFDLRARAVEHAEQTRRDLERDGWTAPV
jgi:hypothetical protein